MKKLLALAVLAGAAYAGWLGWQHLSGDFAGREAVGRVEQMIAAKAAGDEQSSLAMWLKGIYAVQYHEVSTNTARFDAFVREVGMTAPRQWRVLSGERHGEGPAVLVRAEIDGREVSFLVTPQEPIQLLR